MKSHMQVNSLQLAQEPLKRMVKIAFKEYLSFICYDDIDFPENVKINIFDGCSSKKSCGSLHIPQTSEEPCILEYEQMSVASKSKEVLYHEFTHLMDFVVINNHISFEDKLHNFKCISEVRAKYIEYLARADFNNIKDDKHLNCNSLLLSSFTLKPISLAEEIKKHNDKITKDTNDITTENFFNVIIQLYYYIGFIVFVENHSDLVIDTVPLIDKLLYILGDNVNTLFEYRKIIPLDFQPINKASLLSIGETEHLIYQYYSDNHIKRKK